MTQAETTNHVPESSSSSLQLGVIADDLTGSVKLASRLESAGVRCPVVTSVHALDSLNDDVQAVVVGRKLLIQPPEEAIADAKTSGETLLKIGAKQLYYKYSALFSSTARGNIGPVAETLMHLTQADHVLFCPARPERNATVYQGRLFLGTQMLHESPRRNDPVTPMTNSNLVEVLQAQSSVKVGLLAHRTLRAGKSASESSIAEQTATGVRFFIVDVIDQDDLERVATLAQDSVLTTGSDDFPVALSQTWPVRNLIYEPKTLLPPAPGKLALLSGSCTPRSVRQLEEFERTYPVYRLDLLQAATDERITDTIIDWVSSRIRKGPVGVATTANPDCVKRVQAELGRESAATLADGMFRRVAQQLFELGVRKFIVAGGETSGTVMDALRVHRVDVAVHDELYGGYCHQAGDNPISLVLKAGSTGSDDFFALAVARLRTADAVAN